MPEPTDDDLVRAAQADIQAFDALYRKYYKFVRWILWQRVGDKNDAEDLVQDVFIKAMRSLSKYEPRGFKYSAYLKVVTMRALMNYYKRKTHDSLDDEESPEALLAHHAGTEEAFDTRFEERVVWKAVESLNPVQRQVLYLFYVEGWRTKKIGKAIGRSENAIKLMLTRVRQRLGSNQLLLAYQKIAKGDVR